jgi:hypothetical protein
MLKRVTILRAAASAAAPRRAYRSMTASILSFVGGVLLASGVQAATLTSFDRVVNDGVYTLTPAQIVYFGIDGANRIGFLRPFKLGNSEYAVGDIFDRTTVLNSTLDDAKILAILNGKATGLIYTGGLFEALSTTTIGTAARGYYEGVAFLFAADAGNIVFSGSLGGSATFNQGQSRGDLDFQPPAPVPVPGALPLLLAGLGGLAVAARRRKAAA